MTLYQIVLKFMREKDKIIYDVINYRRKTEEVPSHIFDEKLFRDEFGRGGSISFEKQEETLTRFVTTIYKDRFELELLDNGKLCPWCTRYIIYNCCFGCTFKEKYKLCDIGGSLYRFVSTSFFRKTGYRFFSNNRKIQRALKELIKDALLLKVIQEES